MPVNLYGNTLNPYNLTKKQPNIQPAAPIPMSNYNPQSGSVVLPSINGAGQPPTPQITPNATQYSAPIGPQLQPRVKPTTPVIPQIKPPQSKMATVFNPQTGERKAVQVGDPSAFAGGFQLETQPPAPAVAKSGQQPVSPMITSTQEQPITPTMPKVETAAEITPQPITPAPLPPETVKAQTTAEEAYQKSLQITPEELSTQEDIDKLVESTKKAYRNISDQPIPLDFITGQMKSVEERALNLSEPLERKMARLQAQRQSSVEASKFALERADTKSAAASEQSETLRKEKIQAQKDKFAQDLSLKNFEEKKRQFGENYAQNQLQIDQTKEKANRDYAMAEKKFEEDKRQFGLKYAQDNKKLAQDAAKKTIEAVEMQKKATSEAINNYAIAKELSGLNTDAITGAGQAFGINAFTNAKEMALYDQIKGILSVNSREKLKGQGAISEFEAATLEKSASAFNRYLSNEDFKTELNRIKGTFANMAGLDADVVIYDDKNNPVDEGQLNREEINSAISQGYTVKYK